MPRNRNPLLSLLKQLRPAKSPTPSPSPSSDRNVSLEFLFDASMLILGIGLAAAGLRFFLLPNQLLDGGAMGISLLLKSQWNLPVSLFFGLVSLPLVGLGWFMMSRRFALKTLVSVVGLSIVLHFWPSYALTEDKLLSVIFGGAAIGLGAGMCLRVGAALDGVDILAIRLTRLQILQFGDIIFLLNAIIFAIAALLINVEVALYSVITYFVAARAQNFMVNGMEEYIAVNILSTHSSEIRQHILHKLGRGATIFPAIRGYSSLSTQPDGTPEDVPNRLEVILCIVTRLEVVSLRRLVMETDPKAFIYTYRVSDTVGGFLKKRPLERL